MCRRKRGGLMIVMILAFIGCLVIEAQPYSERDQGRGPGHGPGPKPKPDPNPPGPPVAANDAATTPENTPVTINVLSNDTDPDNNINAATVDLDVAAVGIQSTATTPKGVYSVDTTGVVTFTPATDASGPATVKYTVSDSTGLVSNDANINVTITTVNSPPVAADDTGSTTEEIDVEIDVLANDSDSDGTLDTSKLDLNMAMAGVQKDFTTPEGQWQAGKGKVKFKPKDNFVGTASTSYVVYDNDNAPSNPATITVTVVSGNVAPVAANDAGSTTSGTPVNVDVVANDTDSDGTIDRSKVDLNTTLAGVQNAATTPQGSWSVNGQGVVTYTPGATFTGSAALSYTVMDDDGAVSNAASITITVTTPNKAPVAVNDTGGTRPGTAATVNVVANDTDSDGTIDPTKVDLNTSQGGIQSTVTTLQGSWSVDGQGIVTYTPAVAFLGNATLNYTVMDDDGAVSNAASITVSVTIANIAPVANNDTGGTTINKPTDVNVVNNDTDADGTIDASKVDLNPNSNGVQNTANTAQGSWKVNSTGVVTYTPIALFLGNATLNYTVMDDKGAVSNVATITITVQALNIAPVAANDNVTTTKNKAVSVNVTENDTDVDGTIDVTKVDLNPTLAGIQNTLDTDQGNYKVNNQGVVTYTPANNFTGTAALQYVVPDNVGALSNTATLSIAIQNVNAAPVAVDDTGATSQNEPVTVNVVSNDTDSDGVIDAAKVDLNPTSGGIQDSADTPQGSFTVNNLGMVTFTPKKDITGNTTLNYTVSDNNGAVSNVAKITIAIQPRNAPIASEDRATTAMNTPVTIDVVANDRDTDGTIDVTTVDLNIGTDGIQKDNTTPQGSFTVNNQGQVTFTPKKDYVGAAMLQYTVKDNKGVLSNATTISITIEEVPNEAPVITVMEEPADTLRYTPRNPVQITETFEVEDADSDSLAVAEIGFVAGTYVNGIDKLLFENTDNIIGIFNVQTGLLTLAGDAPIGDYIDAVRSIRYEFLSTNESHDNIKRIYVRVGDGDKFSEMKQRVIRIYSALAELDIPTAFTPNSDGANDTWRILAPADISGSDFADAEIRVYDKKGTVVFGANGLANAWDGTYQGKHLPVDTYYYTIDLKQKQKRYKGIVAILR